MTDESPGDRVAAHFRRSCESLNRAASDAVLLKSVLEISRTIAHCFRSGGKLLIAGNGGSAADAQHIAGEFLSRMRFDRHPLSAIALSTDTSVLTAISNDYGFERSFERQLRGLARPGDVFLAISTSGRSPNILAALQAARDLGIGTIGFTGNRGAPMDNLCDQRLVAPTGDTPLIQQVYMVAAHAVCELVERDLFDSSR